MSDHGLIYEINDKVLHPLGLALFWTPSSGISTGCMVDSDYHFTYAKETAETNTQKLEEFKKNRIEILSKILNRDQ